MVIDPISNVIYTTRYSGAGEINAVSLDNLTTTTILSDGNYPWGLHFDINEDTLYFVTHLDGNIRKWKQPLTTPTANITTVYNGTTSKYSLLFILLTNC